MKHLPKHLRPRWRYLAVELESWPAVRVSRSDFQRSVWFAAQNLLGDPGSTDADLRVLRFEWRDGEGEAIVRARRGEVEPARAALACVDAVRGDPLRVRVHGVSGTVRAASEKYLGGPLEAEHEERVVFRNDSRRAIIRDGRVDVDHDGSFVGATRLDLE